MTLLLLDTNSLIHRAWHSGQKKGNVALGKFIGLVWDILNDTLPRLGLPPTHAAAILDPPGRNFRHEIFPEYKSNRIAERGGAMQAHFKLCISACEAFSLKTLVADGFEADDLIATYTRMTCANDSVVIVSQDKDLMQLVRDNVWLLDHRTGQLIRNGDVYLRFGVHPDRLQDMLALCGDAADGVPGVQGVGKKGAASLIHNFGSLYSVLQNAENMTGKKLRESLLNGGIEAATLAYRLIELRDVRPRIPAKLDELAWEGVNMGRLLKLLYFHGLKSLAERICHSTGRDAA